MKKFVPGKVIAEVSNTRESGLQEASPGAAEMSIFWIDPEVHNKQSMA